MSGLDNDIVRQVYDELHECVSDFMKLGYPDEAHEAIVFLMCTMILTRCNLFKTNIEHTMEAAFDSIADYVYNMSEDEDEDEDEDA